MAITINGDGTLTGVSVGGLPDGIVDTDMLATDAVSAAKLQSTAITAGDLPVGSIIQVKQVTSNTEYAVNAGTTPTNPSGLELAITPTSSTNKILITVSLGSAQCKNGTSLGYGKIMFNHSGISESNVTPIGLYDVGGSSNMHFSINLEGNTYDANPKHFTVLHSPATTNEITYKLYVWLEGSGTVYINRSERNNSNDYSSLSSITLMEVVAS